MKKDMIEKLFKKVDGTFFEPFVVAAVIIYAILELISPILIFLIYLRS